LLPTTRRVFIDDERVSTNCDQMVTPTTSQIDKKIIAIETRSIWYFGSGSGA